MNSVDGLALYEFRSCPYCARVRNFLADQGARIETRDILSHQEHRDELISATGRQMVPCLRVSGKDGSDDWIFESADIIEYLRAHLAGA